MRIDSDEVQEVTLVDLESQSISGFSQLHYDHGRFVGVAFPTIEHSHVDSFTTTGVYQSNVRFVRYTAIDMPAPSIFQRHCAFRPTQESEEADRQSLPAW